MCQFKEMPMLHVLVASKFLCPLISISHVTIIFIFLLCCLGPFFALSLSLSSRNGCIAVSILVAHIPYISKVLALLLQVGLLQVRILVAARRGKNVWNIGKPPAPNSVPYVPQHIDGRPAM